MSSNRSVIQLSNVQFGFKQSGFHMNDLNLKIDQGEFVGLVGESGSGKSTIGRLLAAIYNRKDAGSLNHLDGSLTCHLGNGELQGDIFDYSYNQLRDFRLKVQYLFQNHRAAVHSGMTVKQTMLEAVSLKYPNHDDSDKMEILCNMLDKVGLLEHSGSNQTESGILSNRSRDLSGGQIKRLALARTLVLEPDILIADEPLTGLDASRKGRVLEYITNIWSERKNTDNPLTVILISHDMGMVLRLCTRIVVLYGDLISKKATIVEDMGKTSYVNDRTNLHPYTRQLMFAMDYFKEGNQDTPEIFDANNDFNSRLGCIYGPMCPESNEKCITEEPILKNFSDKPDHLSACFIVNP